jgi:hypothetical protein
MNKILSSVEFVVKNAKHVRINNNALLKFASNFKGRKNNHWLSEAPLDFSNFNDEEILNFLLVYSATGFCYWGNPKWHIDYEGVKHEGSFAMIAAIMKAHKNGVKILNPEYRSKMDKEEYSKVLEISKSNKILLFDERLKFLNESGKVIIDKYQGKVSNLFKFAKGDVIKLIEILIKNFSTYDDSYKYKGKDVYFYKKAQLFISDVFQTFQNKGIGKLINSEELTALADYRIPQTFKNLGILEYSEYLENKIANGELIQGGSEEEIEIRASMILAVQLIHDIVKEREGKILPIEINDQMWLLRRLRFPNDEVHHKTITTSY